MRVATTTHTRSMCRRWQALAQKIDASAKAGIKYPTFISARIISNDDDDGVCSRLLKV